MTEKKKQRLTSLTFFALGAIIGMVALSLVPQTSQADDEAVTVWGEEIPMCEAHPEDVEGFQSASLDVESNGTFVYEDSESNMTVVYDGRNSSSVLVVRLECA